MTVAQLITQLSKLDGSLKVYVQRDGEYRELLDTDVSSLESTPMLPDIDEDENDDEVPSVSIDTWE